MPDRIRVTVWGENVHDRKNAIVAQIYPDGMHNCIAAGLAEDRGLRVRTATLEEPQHGLTKSVLAETDVLVWWGHAAHGKVRGTVVERVIHRVWEGMGLIALHSAHYSKIFKRLMGTSCSLTWREAGERERLWVCNPGHPIARGIDHCFEIENTEMYVDPTPSPLLMRSSSYPGSKAPKFSAPAAPGSAGMAKSFISAPATRLTRSTITLSLGRFSVTP
jgi:trehalose utilization protein